jgi:hypothetical protein
MMISAPLAAQRPTIPVPGLALTTIARYQADFRALGATLGAGAEPMTLRADFDDPGKHVIAASLVNDTLAGMQLLMMSPPTRCGYPEPSLAQLTAAVKLLPGVTYVSAPTDANTCRARFEVRTNSQESAARLQQLLRSEIGGVKTFVGYDGPVVARPSAT